MHRLVLAGIAMATAAGGAALSRSLEQPRGGRRAAEAAVAPPSAGSDRNHALPQARRQIAADLHDGALQLLAGGLASLRLAERLLATGGREQAAQPLADGIHLVQAAVHEIRSVLFDHGPQDAIPLAASIQRVMRRFAPAGPTAVHLGLLPDLSGAPAVEQAVAGIVGEALMNAVKHANARNVWIEVSVGGETVVGVVRDDGVGFDPREIRGLVPGRTVGLTLIEERARHVGGSVTILSQPGSGTRIEATLPLDRHAP